MIEVKQLSKSFEKTQVLNSINTIMFEKQMNMIIGVSGGGKTVLMKILLGILKPDLGKIIYDGVSLFDITKEEKKILMSKIGMVFQGSALFDSYNVLENVMMPLDFHTTDKYAIKLARVKVALGRVNLSTAISKRTNELSGGMKKRVAIARAMILNPKYFLLDEPNAGLDPQTSMLIDKLINELTIEKNMTTIINTHDMNSILTMGDSINFLSKGKLCWKGNYKDINKSDNEELKQFVFASKFASLQENY